MEVTLVLIQKDQRQKEIKLSKTRTLVGRNTDCTIRIPVASVSRHHCEIMIEDDELVLRDLKSGNGTYVNRTRIKAEQSLSPGDLVTVGPAVFVVRIDGKPANVNPTDALKAGSAPEPAASTPTPSAIVTKPATASASKPAPEKKSAPADPEDSSMSDFDFLDDDEDEQPKL